VKSDALAGVVALKNTAQTSAIANAIVLTIRMFPLLTIAFLPVDRFLSALILPNFMQFRQYYIVFADII